MTRVTYDTSVFLNGLLNPHGAFPKLFALPDEIQLVLSDQTAEEIFQLLLQSPRLHEVMPALQSITLEQISQFVNEENMVPMDDESMAIDIDICSNAADNKFLVTALALGCDCLVTAVPDLLALEGNENWENFLAENQISCRIVDVDTFLSVF